MDMDEIDEMMMPLNHTVEHPHSSPIRPPSSSPTAPRPPPSRLSRISRITRLSRPSPPGPPRPSRIPRLGSPIAAPRFVTTYDAAQIASPFGVPRYQNTQMAHGRVIQAQHAARMTMQRQYASRMSSDSPQSFRMPAMDNAAALRMFEEFPEPRVLLGMPPYHLHLDSSRTGIVIRCSHTLTLQVLKLYLEKWYTSKGLMYDGFNVRLELASDPEFQGYDSLHLNARHGQSFPAPLMQSILEGVFGYVLVHASVDHWQYKREKVFDQEHLYNVSQDGTHDVPTEEPEPSPKLRYY